MPRAFDGRHLQLPGASGVISLRDHQKRAVWRIISAGSTYIAHAVGAGKTFSMAAAIMEQRRLGLVSKAMMVVPGHCLAQASREFLLLYPNAQILVADESNFVKEKRQRFLARAATGNWDCIIITHSAFKFIPAPARFEKGLIDAQIQSYVDLLEKVDQRRPHHPQAAGTAQGAHGGEAGGARGPQGRHADHRRDRHRSAGGGRGAEF